MAGSVVVRDKKWLGASAPLKPALTSAKSKIDLANLSCLKAEKPV